jgi:glycosyltransferase involved in cell wall biosynthesis
VKCLVVSQYFWPETFGINRQVADLVAQGVEVVVLTGKPNYPKGAVYSGYKVWGVQHESHGGVSIIRMPLWPRGQGSAWRLVLNYLSFVIAGLLVAPWVLRRQKFDAVLVYAPSPILQAIPAILIAWLKSIPLVLWVQDLWPQSLSATGFIKNRAVLGLVGWLVRRIYGGCDLILVQSRAFLKPVRQAAPPNTAIRYYPNSAELLPGSLDLGTPGLAAWPGQMQDRFSVVFTGNVGTAQSVETILDAAGICAADLDICFFVVGDGSRQQWLASQITQRKLTNVILTGWLPVEAMPKVWEAAAVLLVTLRDEPIFHQTIPNKLQSYMAAGRPVIACLGGEGAQAVIDANAGIVCPPGDARALSEAVRNLKAMPAVERAKLGANAKIYFDMHFHPDVLTEQLIGMLEDICARGA